jgi:hypothetical protein
VLSAAQLAALGGLFGGLAAVISAIGVIITGNRDRHDDDQNDRINRLLLERLLEEQVPDDGDDTPPKRSHHRYALLPDAVRFGPWPHGTVTL